MRLILLTASACLAFALTASAQAEPGFFEGSSAKLTLRNFFSEQRSSHSTQLAIPKAWGSELTNRRTTWIQAAMLDYRSGYTPGLIGLGVDASLWAATNLERGKGSAAGGSDRTLVENDGEPVGEWTRLAIADLRMRVSDTELKVGRFMSENPMLRSKDNRSLPATFEGANLVSNDFSGVTLQAGYLEHVIPRTGSNAERFVSTFGNRAYELDSLSYLGATTKPWQGLTASLFASRFENAWDRYYLGLTHQAGDAQRLGWKNVFTLYDTHDQGSRQLGYIDNTIASLASTLSHGAHAFTLAYQQVFGDEYFDYAWDTSSNYNAISLYSDFNGPNEKSATAKYDVNLAAYGIPGLTASIWYATGWDVDGTHYNGDRNGAHTGYNVRGLKGVEHWEAGLTAGYVVQAGGLKGASLRTIVFHHRADEGQIDGNYDELRVITTLPIDIF